MIGQLGKDLTAALAITDDLPVSSETWAAPGFPRLYVAASLKQGLAQVVGGHPVPVFRGFMSRPH